MIQQYYRTVSWNPNIRNVTTDADELVTLMQLTQGDLPTESNRYQVGCLMSVLSGVNQGLYSNGGTSQTPSWESIIVSPIIRTSIILTPSEILSLHDTPVEIAPAPGVGKYIVPQQIFIKWAPGGVAYTQPGNTNVVMGTTTNNIFQFGTFLISATSNKIYFPNNSASLVENSALQLFNTSGNPTNGDGSFEVVLYYQIATSSL